MEKFRRGDIVVVTEVGPHDCYQDHAVDILHKRFKVGSVHECEYYKNWMVFNGQDMKGNYRCFAQVKLRRFENENKEAIKMLDAVLENA